MRLSLGEVLDVTGGRLAGGSKGVSFTTYHTDSREVAPGGLFFALAGATGDGHRFVADAAARGAAGVVVRDRAEVPPGVAEIRVADTWAALYELARRVLSRVAPVVVGITGSNGKTSTREMAAAVLGTRLRVLKTDGNLNTETGLPLTLLRLEPGDEAAVLEMGMTGPGEIARLAELARPRVGVVTGIGSVHAERFPDGVDGIVRAKGELVQALPPYGLAVLNADDDRTPVLRALSRAPVTTFGLDAGDMRGEGYRAGPDGTSVMTVEGTRVRVVPNGRHQARNALAALAVGRCLGIPPAEGAAALAGVAVAHRLQERPARAGYLVIDDAYNASPESMAAAFDSLAERPRQGRLLALLGEMRELGELAGEAHERAGRRARDLFDRVAVVDVGHGRLLAEAAGAELLPDRRSAADWVRGNAVPGDLVLVKASNGVALHEVVEELVG
jgi:UDP-N-acetylmuramoyl-tripeptide--D-alanyl-D-alanine ligase